ncbi:MAG: hypothetical protein KIT56_04715 [Gammaproteobacteria bacterium]|nr:hypothetical protein [Gammaproteobacteria bacterium]MCW5583180.1 hypothetical protein [Gammaproteobacteria bacterium]
MASPNKSLTKTCNSCGLQKPMSAFLQFTGSQGATYGNICAACRKSNNETLDSPKEPEESTTSTTGVKIDAKTKVKGEIDKREYQKQIEEQYFEDREKQDEKLIKAIQKTQHLAKDEEKHRKNFLEKHSFLDNSKKPQSTSSSSVFGGEDHKIKEGKLDFAAGPVEYTRVAGQIKLTQSPIYQAFKNWLGNAPIVSAAEKAAKQQKNASAEKKELSAFNEYINKNYGPRKK